MRSIENEIQRALGISLLVVFLTFMISTRSFAVSKKELRRIDDKGSVEIVAVYLNPLGKSEDHQQSFELTLDTHSDDLSRYNLSGLSTLKVDGGPEIAASEWKNQGGGGHHLSGAIAFDVSNVSVANYLELVIKNVGGVEVRIFRWDLTDF